MLIEIAPDIWVNPDDVSSVEAEASYDTNPGFGRPPHDVVVRFKDSRTKRLPNSVQLTHVIAALNETCAYDTVYLAGEDKSRVLCIKHGRPPERPFAIRDEPYQACVGVPLAEVGKRAKR